MRQVYLFISLMLAQTGWAESINTVKDAKRYGADAKIVLRCVDQDGLAVANAHIQTGLSPDGSPERSVRFDGYSDTNGCFSISGKSGGETTWIVNKDGFYQTYETRYLFKDSAVSVSNGRWQPYGMTNTVVLKRIIKPIPMLATERSNFPSIPATNTLIGFDMIRNDWTTPWGGGETADFKIIFQWNGKEFLEYDGSELSLVFSSPYAGAYTAKRDNWSSLKFPYAANTNRIFNQRFDWIQKKNNGAWVRKIQDEDEILVLRTRPRADDKGNLIGAHYSIICTRMDFGFDGKGQGEIRLNYIFNLTENDVNLEFDAKRNLLESAKWKR